MSDLISRSELLTSFNNKNIQITFDLPVEEVLGEDVDLDNFAMLVQDAIQSYKKMVIDTIKNQPTAYDIDKVIVNLEQLADASNDHMYESYFDGKEDGIREAIEIVKQGGLSDDVCEWRLDDDDQWHTGCRNKIDNMDNEVNTIEDYIEHTRFNYCPFCRKKIKVVDNDNKY